MRHIDPELAPTWSIAIGEVKLFWVDADELEPLGEGKVQEYVKGGG